MYPSSSFVVIVADHHRGGGGLLLRNGWSFVFASPFTCSGSCAIDAVALECNKNLYMY